jgi:hypothetical protein
MPAVSTLAIVGLGLTAVSTVAQLDAAHDAKKAAGQQAQAQREQAALQGRMADVQNMRSLRASVRQARIARAAIVNVGANAGTSNSSGVLGGTASIDAQRNSNVGYFGTMQDLNEQIVGTQQRQAQAVSDAGEAAGNSAAWGAMGALGGTIFNSTSKSGNGWATIFGSGKKQ